MALTVIMKKDICGVFQKSSTPRDRKDINEMISLRYDMKTNNIIQDKMALKGVISRIIAKDPTKFVHISFANLYQNEFDKSLLTRRT